MPVSTTPKVAHEEPATRTRRWTRSEYYAMSDMGFFEGQRVELIEGEIVMMTAQSAPHSMWSNRIAKILEKAFGTHYFALQHSPLSLAGNSDPEPDVAVIKGDPSDFLTGGNPSTAALVVEVSLSSYLYDRNTKSTIYARGGIQEYWIVNLLKNQLEVLRDPQKKSAKSFFYASCRTLAPGGFVSPLALPHTKIAVSELFPQPILKPEERT